MILYSAVIPTYNSKGDSGKKSSEEVIDAEDPANREKVRQIMEQIG